MTVKAYLLPRSLPEALGQLEQHGLDLLVMAGGTVAMPLINDGISLPTMVMGLRLAGLDGIERVNGRLRIGATTTLTQLVAQDAVPALREAAQHTASWAIRNMATVGGNLFTPPPGGDVAVALLALDASVTLASSRSSRVVSLGDFYTGFMTNELAPDELLTELWVPVSTRPTAFVKFGRKHANTPAVVTVAATIDWDGDRIADVRIALGAAGPHPVRASAAERVLVGSDLGAEAIAAAGAAAAQAAEPPTDGVATEWYRRRMIELFVARALEQLAAGAAREDH